MSNSKIQTILLTLICILLFILITEFNINNNRQLYYLKDINQRLAELIWVIKLK
jgi:hypothetical protein